jgi:uncharacterized protein (TIGR00255 family)
MALNSMTGFARVDARQGDISLLWELRSVNGKSLDLRFRLPPGYERLEPAARQVLQKRLTRGNVQATLSVTGKGPAALPIVNEAFLESIAALAKRLEERFGVAPASADGLLALKGVLDIPDAGDSEEARAAIETLALSSLEKAVAALVEARAREGEAIGAVLGAQVDTIAALTARAEADPSREPSAIRARLAEQVALLTTAASGFDEARLHQEAAILATKADIREEIDRLKTHVASARALLKEGGPVGRKLDFLAQEFNRESNTLCSKANAGTVTAIGLELKAVVDQFREQVQNLE